MRLILRRRRVLVATKSKLARARRETNMHISRHRPGYCHLQVGCALIDVFCQPDTVLEHGIKQIVRYPLMLGIDI